MSASNLGQLKAEPNLTPLLDLVFQLITFFMLLVNFGKDEFNSQIRLPSAGSARPPELSTSLDDNRFVIHVDREGRLLIRKDQGGDRPLEYERAMKYIRDQASYYRTLSDIRGTKIQRGEKLPATLVIRADREIRYEDLHRIITGAQAEGFQDIALKALARGGP
ncbi:Biopolymer transport protein ExbD/TolR [Isosphaera pallida ATCC 43644]|uniref:Biopolymer transport protein ExbD/TolR n=1 Tax=Isosphaera pallida (strain ATCC 43644 / DSM 9630 / IS1B) TaxID=575540 RepID=E8QZ46_ISOPI|nr:biopolymer transporter ExbD [Isosphaera pallida]ADV63188.1 Biopolymer transport protein ExbD/TolR [Isosphaera pallida ATCC 43644]